MRGPCLISLVHDRLGRDALLTHHDNGHAVPESIVKLDQTSSAQSADWSSGLAGVSENKSFSPDPRASPPGTPDCQTDHQCNPQNRSQLTRLRSASRPAINPQFSLSGSFLRDQSPQLPEASPSESSATVASRESYEFFELDEFDDANSYPEASTAEPAPARAHNSGGSRRSFDPAANSQSLAGLRSEPYTDWEKTYSSEQRPRGTRSTRLRFWTEALKRRAHPARQAQVDLDTETAATMKFSHSIQFNAVPDWSTNYIAYSNLKKM